MMPATSCSSSRLGLLRHSKLTAAGIAVKTVSLSFGHQFYSIAYGSMLYVLKILQIDENSEGAYQHFLGFLIGNSPDKESEMPFMIKLIFDANLVDTEILDFAQIFKGLSTLISGIQKGIRFRRNTEGKFFYRNFAC